MEKQDLETSSELRDRLKALLSDVKVLLAYLGQLADPILQAHFEDTRKNLTEIVRLRSTPPCRTYHHFLARLSEIGVAVIEGKSIDDIQTLRPPNAPPAPGATPAAPEGDETQDGISFLYWSRDFLASVAAPATIESIAITRAYIEARTRGRWVRRLGHILLGNGFVHGREPLTRAQEVALSLSGKVGRLELWSLGVLLVTLGISVFALAGRTAVQQQQAAAAVYGKTSAVVAMYLQQHPDAAKTLHFVPADNWNDIDVASSVCATSAGSTVIDPGAGLAQPIPVELGTAQPVFAIAQMAPGCVEWNREFRSLFAVTLHLHSWSSIIVRHWGVQQLFGVVPQTIEEFANDMTSNSCRAIGGPFAAKLRGDVTCERVFEDMIENSSAVANSILSALTLYLLPCLYAYIGAAAATMRMLRRKIDGYQLGYTDRGRIRQSLVLGVMCGAMIGLFAGYLMQADAATGLGLSALALLAGYNVVGVFGFMDELSERVFRPAKADGKG